MEKYIVWFARLGRFYRILLLCALVTGITAVAVGTGTDNVVFVAVGFIWILGGSGVVWMADRRERA